MSEATQTEQVETQWKILRGLLELLVERDDFDRATLAYLIDRWDELPDHRPEILARGQEELYRSDLRHSLDRLKGSRGSKEWRAVIALDPRPSKDVAEEYGVSRSTVCNYRRAFGFSSWKPGRPRRDRFRPRREDCFAMVPGS